MLSTSGHVRRIHSQITADNYTIETVKEFVYLKNDVSLEIKHSITLVNMCYYGLNGQLSNTNLSRTMKLIQDAHPICASL